MKYKDIVSSSRLYTPAYSLDRIVSPRVRRSIRTWATYCAMFLGLVVLLQALSKIFPYTIHSIGIIDAHLYKIRALFILASLVSLKWVMVESFYYSHVMRSFDYLLGESGKSLPVSYDCARVVLSMDERTPLRDFVMSPFSQIVFDRLDIPRADISGFIAIAHDIENISVRDIVPKNNVLTYADIARLIYTSSEPFASFLSSYGITEKMWTGVTEWVSRSYTSHLKEERFWSREMLGRVPSLGKDWAFGKAYTLMKYANVIQEEPVYKSLDESMFSLYRKEFEELETVLVRSSGANALIVSEEPDSGAELVGLLAMSIERGYAYPVLEGKRVFFLRATTLLNGVSNKNEFEAIFETILKEAKDAGNIILAIDNLPLLTDTAHAYESDLISILGIFLSSSDVHVIGMADERRFHDSLEPQRALMSYFEKVTLATKNKDAVLRILEDDVLLLEAKEGVLFTYPALHHIVSGAERYFADSFLYDKAKDILIEAAALARREKKHVVHKQHILELLEQKTGIPQGEVKEFEKDKLLNLETSLHRRVIGQDEAIQAVAKAMRRSRAGVANPHRPIGSFLFLGPTGVGKTETTKALAEAFFGSEESIVRFDMSEYSTDDALKRLIGSFEGGKSGLLASRLREKPYAVLLLDEFEKTNKEVLDLFLQILDEGFFTDMNGDRVNVRNAIIIATSNAGSNLIFNYAHEDSPLAPRKDEIIRSIIDQGIFKPELVNRFDGTIIFHPLSKDHLKKIAGIMLVKLEARLKEKGIKLAVTDELITHVAERGMDPAFGARPMNRYIQEKLEALLADRIIRGQINEGDTVSISAEELETVS